MSFYSMKGLEPPKKKLQFTCDYLLNEEDAVYAVKALNLPSLRPNNNFVLDLSTFAVPNVRENNVAGDSTRSFPRQQANNVVVTFPNITIVPDVSVDTITLSQRVKHYLKHNQIQWSRFSTLVLGVSQSYLSTLVGRPKPWDQLSLRVRALYERMQLWMDTRATYGNNPYMQTPTTVRTKSKSSNKNNPSTSSRKKVPRSMFDYEENSQLLAQLEELSSIEDAIIKGHSAETSVVVEAACIDENKCEELLSKSLFDIDVNDTLLSDINDMPNENWDDLLGQVEDMNARFSEESIVFI